MTKMHHWLQHLRRAAGRPLRHRIGAFEIELPAEHPLPQYQAAHPRYDRFLPHLVAPLDAGDLVIDVGANCGDTLAAMLDAHAALDYLCIEPEALFFDVLQRNAARLRSCRPQAQIQLVQALVGQALEQAVLRGLDGTRSARATGAGQGQRTVTLDSLVQGLGAPRAARVRLLKCDVDGWDFDVLDSASQLLRQRHPLLYVECQLTGVAQRDATLRTWRGLFDGGYACVHVFDNFGSPMQRCDSFEPLAALIDYVWQQDLGRATRTVHYLDLLACSAGDTALAARAMRAHLQ